MRVSPLMLLFIAAPAAAQQAPVQVPPGVEHALNDPATADRLANTIQALSQAFLDLPVGGVEAAVEGRQATPAEKRMTVRDLGRRDDPDFDRNFQRHMAEARPMIHQGMKAMADALPAMMRGLQQAEQALQRATANMPDPNYPKR